MPNLLLFGFINSAPLRISLVSKAICPLRSLYLSLKGELSSSKFPSPFSKLGISWFNSGSSSSYSKSDLSISISSSGFFTTSLYKLCRLSKRVILFKSSLDSFPYFDWLFSFFDFSKYSFAKSKLKSSIKAINPK